MEAIIEPIDRIELEKELTKDKFVRETNNANNEIYIIDYHNSPMVMREIARLRELSFRSAGGGTGKGLDMDQYDISMKHPYQQLIVWSPEDKEIIGGYRYLDCSKLKQEEYTEEFLATCEFFKFSNKFLSEYLPYSIELGRSFVQPYYQSIKNSRKGMFSLDNLWDGLGAIIVNNPNIKFFFGKITMYSHFNEKARDLILYFFHKYFPDEEKLVLPIHPIPFKTDLNKLETIFSADNFDEDYKSLIKNVRILNENIPPLFNAYMNLSPTMKTFGTAYVEHFGRVEETGILISIEDIYKIKKERHISTYLKIS